MHLNQGVDMNVEVFKQTCLYTWQSRKRSQSGSGILNRESVRPLGSCFLFWKRNLFPDWVTTSSCSSSKISYVLRRQKSAKIASLDQFHWNQHPKKSYFTLLERILASWFRNCGVGTYSEALLTYWKTGVASRVEKLETWLKMVRNFHYLNSDNIIIFP